MKGFTKTSVILLGLAALTACRIEIDVPVNGRVETVSGKYHCDGGDTCTVEMFDTSFGEEFIAVPDVGYSFAGWKVRDRGFCGARVNNCVLSTTGFPGNSSLLNILHSDQVFYLEPIFKKEVQACGGGGGINFSPSQLPSVTGRELITDIASTDLNGDGLNDLILTRTSSHYGEEAFYQALISNNDRTFTDKTSFYFEGINEMNVAGVDEVFIDWVDKLYVVDINNDGRDDIVSHFGQSHFDEMPPLVQMPNGQFERITLGQFNDIGSFVPIDADNDGDIDLMAHAFKDFGDPIKQKIGWKLLVNQLIETGKLSFKLGEGVIGTAKGDDQSAFIYSPVVLDINADGLDDILYSGPRFSNGRFVDEIAPYVALINQGGYSFSDKTPTSVVNTQGLTHVREMGVADFNGDLNPDVIVSSYGYDGGGFEGEKNELLLSTGTGKLSNITSKQRPFNYRGFTHSFDYGDIDCDGDIDIVFSDITGLDVAPKGSVQLFFNDGNANFTRKSTYFGVGDADMYIVSTKLVDLNGDGFLDLVLGGDEARSPAVVVWNNGSGNF